MKYLKSITIYFIVTLLAVLYNNSIIAILGICGGLHICGLGFTDKQIQKNYENKNEKGTAIWTVIYMVGTASVICLAGVILYVSIIASKRLLA